MHLKTVVILLRLILPVMMDSGYSGSSKLPYNCYSTIMNRSRFPDNQHPYLTYKNYQGIPRLLVFQYLTDLQSIRHIHCNVPKNETLDFNRIEAWIESATNASDMKFLLDVDCGTAGGWDLSNPQLSNVSNMAYPVYTQKLVGVNISGCGITNYWRSRDDVRDLNKTSELRVYRLYHVKIFNPAMQHNIYTCDPPSLRYKHIETPLKNFSEDYVYQQDKSKYKTNLHDCPKNELDCIFYRRFNVDYQLIKTIILAEKMKLRFIEFVGIKISSLLNFLQKFSINNGFLENLVVRVVPDSSVNGLSLELLKNYVHKKIPMFVVGTSKGVDCDCHMFDAIVYMKSKGNQAGLMRGTNMSSAIGPYNMKCSDPPDHIRNAHVSECKKNTRRVEILVSSILSTSVMLILTMAIFIKHRKVIRVLIYTRFKVKLFARFDVHSKKYDAFIAYNKLNEDWVVRTLLPRLETNHSQPFRLCIHSRDFEVGAAITDNITKSIENSRHTIMILSKSFVESEWCLMEFRTAYHQSLKDGSRHLIAVVMEDITDDDISEMEADLRYHLQSTTYLSFQDRWFWDKLIYALSTKPPIPLSIIQPQELEVLIVTQNVTTV